MNTEKLLLLADLLERNAADDEGMKFDLSFVNVCDGDQPMSRDCGTTGCAIGLACVSPEFPELQPSSMSTVMLNNQYLSWDTATAEVFDIGIGAVYRLFTTSYYPPESRKAASGERAVAARIRDYVARGFGALEDLEESWPGASAPLRISKNTRRNASSQPRLV